MNRSSPVIVALALAAGAGCRGGSNPPRAVLGRTTQTENGATAPATTTSAAVSLVATVPNAPPGAFFSRRDEELLGRYGGHFIPTGEGPLVRIVPVDGVYFDCGRVLNNEDFAATFPAVQRMDPYRLHLGGHRLSDQVVELLNRLRSVRLLDLQHTDVSYAGLRNLRLKTLKTLVVPETINETQRRELERMQPRITVR